MGKNPRKPAAVQRLIADAKERQIENAVVRFVKGIIASDKKRRDSSGGGGTRKNPR